MRKTLKDVNSTHDFIRSNFEQVNIHGGDKVTIIFDDEGNILALGKDDNVLYNSTEIGKAINKSNNSQEYVGLM